MFTVFPLQERGEIIATYALCGFANLGSIGIMLGGLGAMAPEKKRDMSKIVLRAMIAGNVACFMTACIAGKAQSLLPCHCYVQRHASKYMACLRYFAGIELPGFHVSRTLYTLEP